MRSVLIKKIKKLIANGNTEKAIELLVFITKNDKEFQDDAVLLSSRFHSNEKALLIGTITRQEANLEFTRINRGVLYMANKIQGLPWILRRWFTLLSELSLIGCLLTILTHTLI